MAEERSDWLDRLALKSRVAALFVVTASLMIATPFIKRVIEHWSGLAGAMPGFAPSIIDDMMRPLLTVILLAASVYVILSSTYGPKDKHWAYATAGALMGFWLRA